MSTNMSLNPRAVSVQRLGRAVFLAIALSAIWTLLLGSQAQASYTCGTGWTLYRAPTGVRCVVRRVDGGVATYAWYGEGSYSNGNYRHIGWVSWNAGANQYRGSVVDIVGGGATINNFVDGTFAIGPTASDYPNTMTAVTWSETWTKVSGGTANDYTTPLTAALKDCGPRFRNGSSSKLAKFRAYDWGDSATSSHTGVRCALRVTAPSGKWNVWYGAGSWRTRASEGTKAAPIKWAAPQYYAHVGYRHSSSLSSQLDLCNGASFCFQRNGTLTLSTATLADTGNGHELSGGGLHEIWIPSKAEHSARLLAYRVSNSNGTKNTPVTPDNVLAYVQVANEIYRPHGVEFLFNRSMPTGLKDFDNLADSSVNTMAGIGTGTPRRDATFFAERNPTRLVLFFTWGPGTCPAGNGASGTDQNFANIAALDASGVTGCGELNYGYPYPDPDTAHFAHEVGHYLSLAHTWTNNFATVSDAQSNWTASGCPANAYDGDGLSSTLPDVNVGADLGNLLLSGALLDGSTSNCVQGIPFNWAWFPYPRTNIMSYHVSDRAYVGTRTGRCDSTSTVGTTTGSFQNCKEITSQQASRVLNPVVVSGIEQWVDHFSDYIGKNRWWRLE